MIGDWVQVMDAATNTPYNCRVRYTIWPSMENALIGLDNKEISVSSLPAECLYPIPITPEILEKNGFYYGNTASEEDFCNAVGCSYPEDGWCYDEGVGEIKILFPTELDAGLIRLDDQNADRHLEWVFVEPIMLHELQHALKLCGIEKEWTI